MIDKKPYKLLRELNKLEGHDTLPITEDNRAYAEILFSRKYADPISSNSDRNGYQLPPDRMRPNLTGRAYAAERMDKSKDAKSRWFQWLIPMIISVAALLVSIFR